MQFDSWQELTPNRSVWAEAPEAGALPAIPSRAHHLALLLGHGGLFILWSHLSLCLVSFPAGAVSSFASYYSPVTS